MSHVITHSANREVLEFLLMNRAVTRQLQGVELPLEPVFVPGGVGDEEETHTHSELSELLIGISRRVPGVLHGTILGYDVLANNAGVVLAAAVNMTYLAFRLNPPAVADQPRQADTLGEEWKSYLAFGSDWKPEEADQLCRQALEAAAKLG